MTGVICRFLQLLIIQLIDYRLHSRVNFAQAALYLCQLLVYILEMLTLQARLSETVIAFSIFTRTASTVLLVYLFALLVIFMILAPWALTVCRIHR